MKKIQTVAIIGAGALGVMYGQRMTDRLGNERVFFVANGPRIHRYESQGIVCNGEPCDFRYLDAQDAGVCADLVLFAVKFTAIDEAVQAAKGVTGPHTIFISVLNGIESEAVIGEKLGSEHLLYCVVHGMDATKEGNSVTFRHTGTIVFGDKENRMTGDVRAVADLFEGAGLAYEIPEDILHRMWSKLMLNVGVNQVTALFETGYGGIQKEGSARRMVIRAMEEAQRIAVFRGITLTEQEIEDWMAVIDSLDPEGLTSMRQDLLAGRRTEVELFSGTIRKLGRQCGVRTPLNDYLYSEIKKLESQGEK